MAKHAVAYRQQDGQPWIGLKGVATTGDADQMFKDAKLEGWDVRKREFISDARTDSPDFEVIRNSPFDGGLDRLAMSKGVYHTFQNETVLDFAKNLVHGDVTPVAMGQLAGGRRIFMSFQIGDAVTIEGTDDEVTHYLHTMTSHDGSWAFGVYMGNMRMPCQNMIRSIRSNSLSKFVVRHTSTMEGRVQDARTALGVSLRQNQALQEDMAELAKVDLSKSKFFDLVASIYPKPEKDVRGSVKKWEGKVDTLMGIWSGDTLVGVPDTAYKAYQTLNEHNMWYGGVRAGNVESALVRASGFDDATVNKDVAHYRKVLALV